MRSELLNELPKSRQSLWLILYLTLPNSGAGLALTQAKKVEPVVEWLEKVMHLGMATAAVASPERAIPVAE